MTRKWVGSGLKGVVSPEVVQEVGLDHSDSLDNLSPSTPFALGQYILDSLD